ncbi:MAG: glycoside hydrolase family 28 protein [Prevotella sp.]|nr:glycoside hydrolase family 28 protein [Prevotella sp.]
MEKLLKLILLCLLFPLFGHANGLDETMYKQIEQSIKAPQIRGKDYAITKFGAKPSNTAAENQKAIQAAIDKCSKKGGGRVIVPAGQTFKTGAISLKSHVNLHVEEGAVLLFVFEPDLYPIVETSWEGLECFNLSPCVYAFKQTDIAVTGKGTIDGSGSNDTWWPWCGAPKFGWKEGIVSQKLGARPRLLKNGEDGIPMYNEYGERSPERVFGPKDGLRPQLVSFNRCERILLEDVTLLRSPFWVIHPLHSTDITVRRVKMINDGPNGDGCDPECCDRVLIEDCFFNTGDDCIAIKSGRNRDGRERNMPSKNIIIRNCEMKNGHGGVVVGSEISGGCQNVYAHDCVMDSPNLDRVLRIKTNSCRGGIIENINMRNIKVGQCGEAVVKINLDYEHNEICCRGYNPTVRNVNVENVTCNKSKYGVLVVALDTVCNVYDVNIKNSRFDNVANGNKITGQTRDIRYDKFYVNNSLASLDYDMQNSAKEINRQAVVNRNNPVITEADNLASLTVGNGHFATTVDVTGMQSYTSEYEMGVPLTAMSDWGWHRFENTDNLVPDETNKEFDLGHGHKEVYAVEYKKAEDGRHKLATEYFRVNPHRLNLGAIGLDLTDGSGKKIELSALKGIRQELQLYDGKIESRFSADGVPVEVTTACLQDRDAVVYRIKSALLKDGRARVAIRLPYPTGKHADAASDWSKPELHTSKVIASGANYAVVEHLIGSTRYLLTLKWEGDATFTTCDKHYFTLTTANDVLAFQAEYTPSAVGKDVEKTLVLDEQLRAVIRSWNRWWHQGAIVDFGQCTDPRAKELERRVVLSQYLTQINCANAQPPQETGLTYNSWFGRPHLEMTWWHMVDFALWKRPEVVAQILDWYNTAAYPEARKIAQRQGFKGIRWMKMTDPWAGEAPSNTGSFLIWQQPHYIYMAEEMYRAKPAKETLQKYGQQVEETAEFMADFVSYDAKSKKYYLKGATAMQESMSKDFSYNHPFELAYWQYGLNVANDWRERQGKERNTLWDKIANNLTQLPEADGIYTAGLPKGNTKNLKSFDPFDAVASGAQPVLATETFAEKCRNDHPAVLGAFGLLPYNEKAKILSKDKMLKTLQWAMQNWNWQTTWGWDYGMVAMTAARLGQPETALQALLIDTQKNTYLKNGHNFQTADRLRIYLPGNGALLTAVAMMCAGWDGCNIPNNPGFPQDGTWNVRWEGLNKMQ